MLPSALSSSRPAVSVGLATLLAGALALSGCTSTPKAPVVAKSSAAPTTTAVPTPPPFTAKGVPAALAAVIEPLYLGGAVPSSRTAATALGKRKPVKAAGLPVSVSGAVGVWKGARIAVVTMGNDVTLAVAAPKWKVVGGWWPSMGVTAPSLGAASHRVLVIGSDARPGQTVDRARADSLHIVGFDGQGGGGVLGIARDSYVQLSTGGRGKINSALAYGGPVALQRTVVSATGVPLDGYLITGFAGFKKLIDGIGGLPIKVPVTVVGAGADVTIKAGANELTGREALAYGRQRHSVAGGDFGRSANQGLLIMAAAGFAKLVGPAKIPTVLAKAAPNIGTNLSAEQVLIFAAGAYITRPNKVHNRVAAGNGSMTSGGESIVLFDGKARRLFIDMKDGNLS